MVVQNSIYNNVSKKTLNTNAKLHKYNMLAYLVCIVLFGLFMLGESILVAPVITKGTRSRNVVFPSGKWRSQDGEIFDGECTREIESPLGKLLYFEKI